MKEVRQYKQLKSQLDNLQGDIEAMKIDIANRYSK
jgi:TolA-binding protein